VYSNLTPDEVAPNVAPDFSMLVVSMSPYLKGCREASVTQRRHTRYDSGIVLSQFLGSGEDAVSTELNQIKHRIAHLDPKSHALGEEFHDRHIALCEAYAGEQLKRAGSRPPSKWLVEKLDLAEVEKDAYVANLTYLMLPGVELWSYSSPPGSWEHMLGRAGIALLRDGKPISEIRTMMN
jgi:hypothetical protein